MPAGYILVDSQVTDPEQFKNYGALAPAAVAVGVAGLFMETHPDPANALCDGPNAVPLKHMKALLETLLELDRVTKKNGFLENNFN